MAPIICWDREKVEKYFSIEASSTVANLGWDVFEQLHYPIKKIHVVKGDTSGLETTLGDLEGSPVTFIGEEQLLKAIRTAPGQDNTLIGLRGAAGSGKSHLIRWLELKLKDDERFLAIPVPRELMSVSAVLNRICEAVDLPPKYVENNSALREDRGKLTKFIVSWMELRAPAVAGPEWQILTQPLLYKLVRQTVDALSDYRTSGLIGVADPPAASLDGRELREFYAARRDSGNWGDFADTLNSLFAQAWMMNLLGTPLNLTELMTQVDEACRAKGKQPVLLLEDITSFEALHRDLFNFLGSLTSGNFIAVMGWTPGYEAKYLEQENIRQRLLFHLSLSYTNSDKGETTFAFQDSEDVLGLAHTYLDAVRKPCERQCATACTLGTGDGTYPFTATALRNFYKNLYFGETPQFTPRIFLSHVLKSFLKSPLFGEPFPKMQSTVYLRPRPVPAHLQPFVAGYPEWVALQQWFVDDETPDSYYDDLGVRVPGDAPAQSVPVPGGVVVPAPVDDKAIKLQQEYQALVIRVDKWQLDKKDLDSFELLASLVRRDLIKLASIGELPGAHVYGLRFAAQTAAGSTVTIEGSGHQPATNGVNVPRNAAGRHVLTALAYFHTYGSFETPEEGAYVHAQLIRWRNVATDGLRAELVSTKPVVGLALELLVWHSAKDGRLRSVAPLDLVREALSSDRGEGAPLLGAQGLGLFGQVETNRTTLAGLFASMVSVGHHTLDVWFVLQSLDAHLRNPSRAGQWCKPLHTRDGSPGGVLETCAVRLQAFRADKLATETSLVSGLKALCGAVQPLGPGLPDRLKTLGTAFAKAFGDGRKTTLWQPIQALNIPESGPLADGGLVSHFVEGADQALATNDVRLRLSAIAQLRPAQVRPLIDAAKAVDTLLRKVRGDLLQAASSGGGESTEVTRSIQELAATRDALKGGQ